MEPTGIEPATSGLQSQNGETSDNDYTRILPSKTVFLTSENGDFLPFCEFV